MIRLLVVATFLLVALSASAQRQILPMSAIKAFVSAGLTAKNPRQMEPRDFGMAPKVTDDAFIFGIPQVCSDCNARLFSIPNARDRGLLRDYYVDFGKRSAAFYSWVFEHQNLVLQINGDMKRVEAERYKKVLLTLK